jgi:hypothetical protein
MPLDISMRAARKGLACPCELHPERRARGDRLPYWRDVSINWFKLEQSKFREKFPSLSKDEHPCEPNSAVELGVGGLLLKTANTICFLRRCQALVSIAEKTL